jgi:glycosyltransferase involved in cell wall biosynthesis
MNWILRRGAGEFPKHVFVTQNGDWMLKSKCAEYRFFDCDGLVCTNAQYFEAHGKKYPSALIPNGVDPELFFPGPVNRAVYGLPASGPVALIVSALIPSKRVIEGVRAAAAIEGLFLVVAGDGECREEVDAEAGRLLPGRYRRLTLPRYKMPGLYRAANVFLHMSRDEASANAYMEALATGLPIVTHDWQVTRWTLEDCGVLVDCARQNLVPLAIARALAENSPEKVAKRRDLVQRRFAWSSIGKLYSNFLEELTSPAPVSHPMPAMILHDVGVVAIGRNEGDRLVRCLESVGGSAPVVYVDSSSTDQSVANAKGLGAEVVELDANMPLTAARARNAGAQRLREIAPGLKYIQFVDGDCELRSEWLDRARRELEADPKLAAVCGRRRERFPRSSIYNRLMDMEWDTPVGPAKSVGGDAMFRLEAFDVANGFDPTVMAGEEPQLCMRIRQWDWHFLRVDAEMTLHDAAISRFGQWWKRQVRGGYGAMDVYRRFEINGERLFAKNTRSAMMWAVGWPAAVIVAGLISHVAGWIVLLILPLQIARLSARAFLRGVPPRVALASGVLTMLSKWAWFAGQMRYRREQWAGKSPQLIEYKQPPPPPVEAMR